MSVNIKKCVIDLMTTQELRTLYWRLLDIESHPSCIDDFVEKLSEMFNFFGTPNVALFRTDSVSSLVENIPALSDETVIKKVAQDLGRRQFTLWQLAPPHSGRGLPFVRSNSA